LSNCQYPVAQAVGYELEIDYHDEGIRLSFLQEEKLERVSGAARKYTRRNLWETDRRPQVVQVVRGPTDSKICKYVSICFIENPCCVSILGAKILDPICLHHARRSKLIDSLQNLRMGMLRRFDPFRELEYAFCKLVPPTTLFYQS